MKKKKVSMFDVCNTIFMLLILVITLYPLYYTVIASFSSANAVASGKVTWWPVGFTLAAYERVVEYKKIWVGYANTTYYTVLGTLFNLVLTIPAAYTMSKKNLPHRSFITTIFIIPMYFSGGMIPTYLLVKNLELLNTRAILLILGGLSIYNFIVTRTYFSTSISESLYEAADMDGAGELKKFFAIAVPLSKPIIAVMTLYYAVARWNNYFNALIYVTNKDYEPLQAVLRRILILNEAIYGEISANSSATMEELQSAAEAAAMAYTMKYAVVFIASAPLLIMYPFIQKYFVKGVMIGAVKE